jgi:phytoene/squalene synthetase
MELYNKTSYSLSKELTKAYSTSFSLGIKVFAREYRDPIYGIYGFVRVADEIVDTFHEYDQRELFENFKFETYKVLRTGISTNPVLQAFNNVVEKYSIDLNLIEAFLKSMEMDLYNDSYEQEKFDEYVYGSAEVVGLMCLKVFTRGNDGQYNSLIEPARKLGSAFQKVNFLRDIKSDFEERGRIYFPGVSNEKDLTDESKKIFEKGIENDFDEALSGILKLPIGVRLGVYSAYMYYKHLFRKIQKLEIAELKSKRVRISNLTKLRLLIKSFWQIRIMKLAAT